MNLGTLTPDEQTAYLRRVFEGGMDEGMRRALRLLHVRGQQFSAHDEDEEERRVGQQFSSDAAERFSSYFAADEDGHFPGHLHRMFGLGVQEFADRSHLVRKQITNKNGVKTWVWVNPQKGQPAAEPGKVGAGGGKAVRTAHPENAARTTADYHPTAAAEQAVSQMLIDPLSIREPEQAEQLAQHLDVLQKEKLKDLAKQLKLKLSGKKSELVLRLLNYAKTAEPVPVRDSDEKPTPKPTAPIKPPIPTRPLPTGEPAPSDSLGKKPPLPSPQPGESSERGTGSGRDARESPEAGGRVEGAPGEAGTPGTTEGGDVQGQPARAGSPPRIPATHAEIHRRIDRFEKVFRARGLHEQADWMGKLRDHVNAVGGEAALRELGDHPRGGEDRNHAEEAAYPGWESMNDFTRAYLDRNGIEVTSSPTEENPVDVAKLAPLKKFISNVAAGYTVLAPPDAPGFFPSLPVLSDKLAEAQHLPGLEKSEDVGKLMGGNRGDVVSHFSPEVMTKLNETYGEGKWIVKSYGDEAYAGYGIFFPQRVLQIQTDARNAIWASGERIAKHGFKHLRDDKNRIVGIEHKDGKQYRFGTEEFDKTIRGDVREACDSISEGKVTQTSAGTDTYTGPAIDSERHTAFPTGSFMGQPAFPVVGISEEERAQGITFKKGQEGRTHVITRNGKAELVPNSTWLKLEHLPVVFETDDTRAMAKAALDAINALPESERQGQIYAPDILPTADGYRVVEANPSNMAGSSGYLENNPLIIDSYVSHLTGREPAHVKFIRNLLTTRQKEAEKTAPSHADKIRKEREQGTQTGIGFSSSHHDGEEWQSAGRWYRRTYGKTIRISRPGTKVAPDERHVKDVVASSHARSQAAAAKIEPLHEEAKKLNKQYDEHASAVLSLSAKYRSLSPSRLESGVRGKFMREQLTPALAKLDQLAAAKKEVSKRKRAALMESLSPPTPQKIGGNFRSGIDMAEQGGDFQEIAGDELSRAKAVFSPARQFVEGITNGMDGVRIGLGASKSGRACAGIKGEQFFKGSVDYSVTIGIVPTEGDTETAAVEEETAAHEFGHVIEDHKPGVRALVHKFLSARLGDEKPTPLAEVMPGVGFEDYEVGYKDHFEGLFPDEISAYYAGMTYADGYYTEIVSMGMEQLYRDCGHFAEKDPEYFQFMCHILTM